MKINGVNKDWIARPRSFWKPIVKDWLTRRGALTRHLQSLGTVNVQVLNETLALPWRDEAACLNISLKTYVWTREVLLLVDNNPCVIGHSITPVSASYDEWRAIRKLCTRPLADLLYIDKRVCRSVLVSKKLSKTHPMYQLLHRELGSMNYSLSPLFARRSLFHRKSAPLLVTECFLPAFWKEN